MIGETLLNRYTIEAELGKGGMGVVYKAHDALLDRVVAIKFLNASGMGTTGKTRLLQEARAVAKLNHPNIVSVFDAGETDGNPFIVMEMVEGRTLRHVTMSTVAEALIAARDICKALDHAHTKGIIHRDLKLENVILTDTQTVKLMDFGLARTSGQDRLTEEGAVIGTFAYLAPELIQGEPASPQSDLYAFGVILYELLAGHSPFHGTINEIIAQHLHGTVKLPSGFNPNVPAWADNLVLELLGKRPEERPASVREVISIFEKQVAEPHPTFQYKVASKTRNNLPAQLTSFIGRKKEIEQIKSLINVNRLVTLTGVGGTGKTRLSLQAAEELLDEFTDGVWFVELASVTDPDLIVNTVAAALQLQEIPKRTIRESVMEFLAEREVLLVLDNCEHLIHACAEFVNQILQRCGKIKVLITSREPVGISGESIWSVPSLSTPQGNDYGNLELIEKTEAVNLFLDRARAAQPNFELTSANVGFIAQICNRLDGIPLALELAAARVRGMSVEQIASRLDQRFRLLTGGSRAALPRQQTLGALVDWSYNLLTEPERLLFQRLAIFIGPFTLEAAEHVCADAAINEFDVFDLLQRIMDKSLLVIEERYGETYYRMLETIRQYGRDKLIDAEEAETLTNRHAKYFLEIAITSDKELRGPNQMLWFRRLGVLLDNLRAAMEWLIEREQIEDTFNFVTKLNWFWFMRADHTEGRNWLQRILEMPKSEPYRPERTHALTQLGFHTWLQISPEKANPIVAQALALAREHSDKWNTAFALGILALVEENHEELSRTLASESIALFEELHDDWYFAHAVIAKARNEEEYKEVCNLFIKLGDRFMQFPPLLNIGFLQISNGKLSDAAVNLRQAMSQAREFDNKISIAMVVIQFAQLAKSAEKHARAVRLYYAAKNIFDLVGAWGGSTDRTDTELEKWMIPCTAELDKTTFQMAKEQGLALTLDQAIEYALQV